ncbi:MAG: AGE family epimerase/isomerase [Pseudomonadota bacterium]|nr:AGE family epimerase/isomerase [Pseudomonadota bacterium]
MSAALWDPSEFREELRRICSWWLTHAEDRARGGLYGEIGDDNTPRLDADKGVILHTRALWFFSEAARIAPLSGMEPSARELYGYVVEKFVDSEHGGLVWSLNADGAWSADRKQVYAQAFAIYAFSAYARAFDDTEALARALSLARLLEDKVRDVKHGGYIEAFACDWSSIDDVRLSARDLNAPKTMNTHLHVLEAMTALHAAAKNTITADLLARNIDLFVKWFIEPRSEHLSLFYSMDWKDLCADESYGHDIEASWLLWEAAQVLGDEERLETARKHALALAHSTLLKAVGADGGLVYERHADARGLVSERHWWPQAEALVGFYNAYELTGDARFADAAANVWAFIKANHIDHERGEWSWLAKTNAPKRGPYKAGFWKGPYHNGRAMIEMLKRLTAK